MSIRFSCSSRTSRCSNSWAAACKSWGFRNDFGPRLSFFLDCGLDIEYLALARVCRKIWAIGMRDIFKADDRAQRLKLHTQTSGRSLVAHSMLATSPRSMPAENASAEVASMFSAVPPNLAK